MSAVELLATLPVPVLAAAISANAIPYLSALATRRPGWWTGAVTVALSLLGAVLTAVAQSGDQSWRYVAGVTAVMWVVARLHLNTFVKATDVEAALHARGITGQHRAASQRGAVEPVTLFAGLALVLVLALLFTGHWLVAIVALAVCVVAAVLIR